MPRINTNAALTGGARQIVLCKNVAEHNCPTTKAQAGPRKTRAAALAEQLLRDRAERAARGAAAPTRSRPPESNFDPFAITRWRVIGPNGGDPGYLVKAPMRRGPVGWFIACRACAREFESKCWTYCPDCMAMPAGERRNERPISDRPCQGCSNPIPKRRRADAKYCSERCAKSAENWRSYQGSGDPKFRGDTHEFLQQNQGPKNVLIFPTDFPINVIGGFRFPQAKPDPLGRVRRRP